MHILHYVYITFDIKLHEFTLIDTNFAIFSTTGAYLGGFPGVPETPKNLVCSRNSLMLQNNSKWLQGKNTK